MMMLIKSKIAANKPASNDISGLKWGYIYYFHLERQHEWIVAIGVYIVRTYFRILHIIGYDTLRIELNMMFE